jgi:hypothetical protein
MPVVHGTHLCPDSERDVLSKTIGAVVQDRVTLFVEVVQKQVCILGHHIRVLRIVRTDSRGPDISDSLTLFPRAG